ncbi:MAG: diacylglycerol kinase [Candidatus Magasanikbacteria bacterium CG10_big_fil_rev_8_21_14_0_10_36_32]|uniref:Diacylglycerol kinase n=1 Tax=Candidatus Magasanikbacteria bacterium CG10_big_fil_rev_8_21_14_0_10_36_32 TaxID=1974646 RepID=A0A2M6W5I8_9BACT|nr:MAG: diacylglycerol kinase [Candidatus Magasanikbacteria bacterium CG10_big_fil_rev_8_21_14_0_10_36_32]
MVCCIWLVMTTKQQRTQKKCFSCRKKYYQNSLKKNNFMIFGRLKQSFSDAFNGLKYAFQNEQNFRVQTVVATIVLILMVVFPLKQWETILIVMMILVVLVTELLNTALERFTDLLKPRLHHYVKVVKDVMAGAVLLTSLGAVIIGVFVFLPYFIEIFK